jgi:hypothetical protein
VTPIAALLWLLQLLLLLVLRHDDGLTAAQAGIDTNNIGEKKKRCRQSMWDTSMHVGYLARKHVMALTKPRVTN